MAFSSVLSGTEMVASNVSQIIDALSGTAGSGQAIILTKLNDASAYALDVANADTTNSYGLRVQDSAGNNLLLAYKNNVTVGASAANDTMTINANISGKVYIGDSSNANMTAGLTINQGANDDEILALKSSDVAHGATDFAETAVYLHVKKQHATEGGGLIEGFRDAVASGQKGMTVNGFLAGNMNATHTSAGSGAVTIGGYQTSGASIANTTDGGNVLVINTYTGGAYRTVFIVDENGNFWFDGASQVAFDEHDDLALLETVRVLSGGLPDYQAGFAKDIAAHTGVLARGGVIEMGEDGRPFVSGKGLMGLMIDGIRQSGQRIAALEAHNAALTAEIAQIRRILPAPGTLLA